MNFHIEAFVGGRRVAFASGESLNEALENFRKEQEHNFVTYSDLASQSSISAQEAGVASA